MEHEVVDGIGVTENLLLSDKRLNRRLNITICEVPTGLIRLRQKPAPEDCLRSILGHEGFHSSDNLVVGTQSSPIGRISDVSIGFIYIYYTTIRCRIVCYKQKKTQNSLLGQVVHQVHGGWFEASKVNVVEDNRTQHDFPIVMILQLQSSWLPVGDVIIGLLDEAYVGW